MTEPPGPSLTVKTLAVRDAAELRRSTPMHAAFADIMTEAVVQLRSQLEEMHALKAENERLRTELAHARDAADSFDLSAGVLGERLNAEIAALKAEITHMRMPVPDARLEHLAKNAVLLSAEFDFFNPMAIEAAVRVVIAAIKPRIVAGERERCAKICEDHAEGCLRLNARQADDEDGAVVARKCAAAIRSAAP